jgi:hypothetical protein
MSNPGILESWIRGEAEFKDILFFQKQFLKTSLHPPSDTVHIYLVWIAWTLSILADKSTVQVQFLITLQISNLN